MLIQIITVVKHRKSNMDRKKGTGKSFSEGLILASTNLQYDKRLFIDLPVLYMKTTSSEHVVHINCSECQNKNKKTIYVHNMF